VAKEALPAEWEDLYELLTSGTMSDDQLGEVIREHGHTRNECDVCVSMWDVEGSPLQLVDDYNSQSLSLENRRALFETYWQHILPEDIDTRRNVNFSLVNIASGPSADRSLLKEGADLFEYVVEIYQEDEEEDSLETTTRKLANRFASNKSCDREIIEQLVDHFHSDLSAKCSGEFENCETCQGIVGEAAALIR
jgi:hypothetical protein